MKQCLLLLALISLSFSTQISAQNAAGSVEVGVYSAYQFTHFSGGYIELDSSKYIDDVYSTYGYTIGSMVELHISPTVALLGMLRYEELHGSKNKITSVPSKLANGTDIIVELEHILKITAPQIAISILGEFTIPDTKLNLLGGINIGVLIADNEEQRTTIIFDPKNPVQYPYVLFGDSLVQPIKDYKPHFLDETRQTIVQYTGPIYQRKSLQLGLTAGLQYDLPIYTLDEATQKFVTLTPSVLFNYNLTTYSDYEKLRAWTVSAGFALKVGL